MSMTLLFLGPPPAFAYLVNSQAISPRLIWLPSPALITPCFILSPHVNYRQTGLYPIPSLLERIMHSCFNSSNSIPVSQTLRTAALQIRLI